MHVLMWFVVVCRFSPEAASRRGLSTAEMNAVEAIHRAVEFNPHVPKVSHTLIIIIIILFGHNVTLILSAVPLRDEEFDTATGAHPEAW